ncbi:MAG TPA: A/G-specific adenine glycosylase [Gallionella sp.]|nr:A/G-specific adenine glycosylase [Gallionella sp.]
MHSFPSRLIRWQRQHGRHDLPWQEQDAYRVWLSEIMLQQTQVATVIPYYQRFVDSFPNIAALAAATEDEVLAHWSGLGYYARGRNLHKAAMLIAEKHDGEFPREFDQILELPGIGRSTAAAICAQAYHESRAILDGNVKRVLARWCGIDGWAGNKKVEEQLWQQAENLLPPPCRWRGGEGVETSQVAIPAKEERSDIATYTQALMDLGATVCTRGKPKCGACPVSSDCVALQSGRVAELPTPRPKKAVPEKYTTFLLLMSGRDILLEKRPGSGIWGGLWCPPQLDDGQGIVEDYLQLNGVEVSERIDLPEFTHIFTHFKLHITPVLLQVAHKPLRVQQVGSVWLDVEEALRAAIPTPVRKVLEQI